MQPNPIYFEWHPRHPFIVREFKAGEFKNVWYVIFPGAFTNLHDQDHVTPSPLTLWALNFGGYLFPTRNEKNIL